MAAAPVVGRLALAAPLAVAAVAKLRDLPGSRRALADFGVPRGPAALLGTLLPFAELAIAGGCGTPSAPARDPGRETCGP